MECQVVSLQTKLHLKNVHLLKEWWIKRSGSNNSTSHESELHDITFWTALFFWIWNQVWCLNLIPLRKSSFIVTWTPLRKQTLLYHSFDCTKIYHHFFFTEYKNSCSRKQVWKQWRFIWTKLHSKNHYFSATLNSELMTKLVHSQPYKHKLLNKQISKWSSVEKNKLSVSLWIWIIRNLNQTQSVCDCFKRDETCTCPSYRSGSGPGTWCVGSGLGFSVDGRCVSSRSPPTRRRRLSQPSPGRSAATLPVNPSRLCGWWPSQRPWCPQQGLLQAVSPLTGASVRLEVGDSSAIKLRVFFFFACVVELFEKPAASLVSGPITARSQLFLFGLETWRKQKQTHPAGRVLSRSHLRPSARPTLHGLCSCNMTWTDPRIWHFLYGVWLSATEHKAGLVLPAVNLISLIHIRKLFYIWNSLAHQW